MRGSARDRCAKTLLPAMLALCLALPAVAGEGGFRHWGVGWFEDPGARYRTPAGWEFTVFVDWGDSASDELSGGDSWSGDDVTRYTRRMNQSRSVKLQIARLFPLGKGVLVGPEFHIGHSYAFSELDIEYLEVDYDDETFYYDRDRDSDLDESYSVGVSLKPQWRFHRRLSVETSFGLYYSRHFSRDTSFDYEEHSNGNIEERDTERSYTSEGWQITDSWPNIAMMVGLFFYF